jgi:hypothetical protein
MAKEMDEVQRNIRWYEQKKAQLRQQIEALSCEDIQCENDEMNESTTSALIDMQKRITSLDSALASKTKEVAQLHSQIATLTDNNNTYSEQSNINLDDEIAAADAELADKQHKLKLMIEQATQMGIQLKPDVWV